MKSLAFTGHRPKDLGGYDENNPIAIQVKNKLNELILLSYQAGYREFVTGMAMGVDQWAGEIVANLKEHYDDIRLIAAVPFENQPSVWFGQSRLQWQYILEHCDEIHVVDREDSLTTLDSLLEVAYIKTDEPKYVASKKLNDRNKWMVNRVDCILAIWKHTSGGTGNCVQYAQSKSKKIIAYNPDDDTVERL